MKLRITESELVNMVRTIIESDDDIRVHMKRRHGGLLQSIQKQVAEETDPNVFGDEFEYADNILTWAISDFVEEPGNEWLNDRYDELMDYAKEEFGEELFEVYRDMDNGEYEDEDDEEFDENLTEQFNREQLYSKEYVTKMLKDAPVELRRLIKKLPSIPCENGKGEKTICTKIPETIHVYLTGRY